MVLLAKDIMDRNVLFAPAGLDARSAARQMVGARKGYIVLQDDAGRVAGIVTEWDFLEKVLAPGRDPGSVALREIGTSVVHACAPETPTDEVVATMAHHGIRRMMVRSGDRVVGIITSRTVLAHFREYVDRITAEIAGYQQT